MTSDPTPGIWRRLLDSANAAVERPADPVLARDFKHCAELANSRGVLPFGSVGEQAKDRARPFTTLIGFGKAWTALTIGARRANGDAVLCALEACEAQLAGQAPETPEPSSPAWMNRADIGG